MKKYGDKPLTQQERNRRYLDKNGLSLFAVRIKHELAVKLMLKLNREDKTKKQFLIDAIEDYLHKD